MIHSQKEWTNFKKGEVGSIDFNCSRIHAHDSYSSSSSSLRTAMSILPSNAAASAPPTCTRSMAVGATPPCPSASAMRSLEKL